MARPERASSSTIPSNPVYLLPLVEGRRPRRAERPTRPSNLRWRLYQRRRHAAAACAQGDRWFYRRPTARRALWRWAALWLVNDGVATTEEIDDAIRFGAGLRWSFMGTFLIYRMAGGEAGMRHFLAQFGPTLKLPWTKLEGPELTDELIDLVSRQSDEQAAGASQSANSEIRGATITWSRCSPPCAPRNSPPAPSSKSMSSACATKRRLLYHQPKTIDPVAWRPGDVGGRDHRASRYGERR